MDSFAAVQKRIGYAFSDCHLLQRALTHRSASLSMNGMHMERLEFLGDAVLGLVISELLHTSFPDKAEGDLSRMRSLLVRRESLLEVAESWHLASHLIVGESERNSSRGIKSPSIAANAVEAVIGAAFEDGGWESARKIIKASWKPLFKDIGHVDMRDAKSRLQELTQANSWGLPEYRLEDHGVDTSPRFTALCYVEGRVVGKGSGARKKLAELEAAEEACGVLESNE